MYFTVHANRRVGRDVPAWQTQKYASFIQRFFDTDVMAAYRPEYVARDEYLRRVRANPLRQALTQASSVDWGRGISRTQRRFVKRDEAGLARQLTEAQKAAATLEPRLRQLCQLLEPGEAARDAESSRRWQAGYDLAMGRALAARVRAESYNALLAQAKRGLTFENERNNTWVARPTNQDRMELGSQLDRMAEKARTLLQRVVEAHPDTPWAYLAQRELRYPVGWRWDESFTDLNPEPSTGDTAPNPLRPAPRDDRRRMLTPPKPKRPLPNL